jgi:hypothetical protein
VGLAGRPSIHAYSLRDFLLRLQVNDATLAVVDPGHQTLALEAGDCHLAEINHGHDLSTFQLIRVVVVGQAGG